MKNVAYFEVDIVKSPMDSNMQTDYQKEKFQLLDPVIILLCCHDN